MGVEPELAAASSRVSALHPASPAWVLATPSRSDLARRDIAEMPFGAFGALRRTNKPAFAGMTLELALPPFESFATASSAGVTDKPDEPLF